jgi:hypothetical protein
MVNYIVRPLLRIFSGPPIQNMPEFLPDIAGLVEWRSPEGINGGLVCVNSYARIEEVEVEYSHEGIE